MGEGGEGSVERHTRTGNDSDFACEHVARNRSSGCGAIGDPSRVALRHIGGVGGLVVVVVVVVVLVRA